MRTKQFAFPNPALYKNRTKLKPVITTAMLPHPRLLAVPLSLLLTALSAAPARAATRFDEFTAKYATPAQPARVLAAGLLGGRGTEWLAGGGFQPDGTVVVAGVSLGPVLDLGAQEIVLGRDAALTAPTPAAKTDKKGQPELDKDGKPKLKPFAWNHENATAFVVRLSSDLKTIKSTTRLGWKTGGLTGTAVDAAGNIFICGPATPGIAALGGDVQELPAPASDTKRSGCTHSYLARLTPDASKIVWVRHVKAASDAPALTLDAAGQIHFSGPDFRVFDASGKQLSAIPIPGGAGGFAAVNPVDGTIARGGEHHWQTGREPWRCPTLNIHKPDGSLLYQLYDWGGPLVGLNNLRLVSDTAIRGVTYDAQGNLIFHAWSDGGNSVALREPTDLRANAKMNGLGFSAWGAGVLSLAYVVKIETKNYRVLGGTPWMAYQKTANKPNSARINTLAATPDGSVCFAGSSTWGLIQTGNAIGGGEPGGEFVAVLNDDCSALRFSSAMPACGQTIIDDNSADQGRWAIASGKLNGKPVALFLCGATERNSSYDQNPPPAVNTRQPKFGGGHTDGFALLLDLSK